LGSIAKEGVVRMPPNGVRRVAPQPDGTARKTLTKDVIIKVGSVDGGKRELDLMYGHGRGVAMTEARGEE